MGMAASQARLLSITARLTNNENSGQAISYSKQRLADQTQQITNEYNEALNTTKLTVLTGFNGAEANYTDISYNLMTGIQMAEMTKQYVVTDTKGRILVTNDIANAYEKSRGNYNAFLAALGTCKDSTTGVNNRYSQADITVNRNDEKLETKDGKIYDTNPETLAAKQKIHEAWDKYFESVGIKFGDEEHPVNEINFSWTETYLQDEKGNYLTKDKNGNIIELPKDEDSNGDGIPDTWKQSTIQSNGIGTIGDGYVGYKRVKKGEDGKIVKNDDGSFVYEKDDKGKFIYDPISYEGTTPESRDLYDYAMAITEAYLRVNPSDTGVPFKTEYDMENIKSAAEPDNAAALKYYRNIFDKIQACGYFTYMNSDNKEYKHRIDETHLYASEGTGKVQKDPMKDNYTFEQALRNGTLRLEYYSSTDRGFKSTTISEDNCIQEVADERAIAKAESKYTQDMADLEQKDNRLDLDLKRLDTEHKALETEYESVKSVVDKNVESSFKIFS